MPTLEITTMIGCPMRCTFCPQDKLIANYTSEVRALSLENFKTILAKVPRHVRIDFSGMSEPWANRHATNMLEHVLRDGRNVTIYTTLQGMHDCERVISLLLDYRDQVEAIVVHLPDAIGNMRGFRPSERYDATVLAFRDLKEYFGDRLQFMCMSSESEVPWSPLTRAGNVIFDGQDEVAHHTPLSCSYTPFYDQNVLLPNGDVVLCCMDYSCEHKLGNLLIDDYYSLFQSIGDVMSRNMQYGSAGSICRKCSRARTHDLDGSNHFWTWSC